MFCVEKSIVYIYIHICILVGDGESHEFSFLLFPARCESMPLPYRRYCIFAACPSTWPSKRCDCEVSLELKMLGFKLIATVFVGRGWMANNLCLNIFMPTVFLYLSHTLCHALQIVAVLTPIGSIKNVLLLRGKGQAFVEMSDIATAVNVVTYFPTLPVR